MKTSFNSKDAEINFRYIDESDVEDLFEWRNHPEVRKNSFNMAPLIFKEHEEWFKRKIKNSDTTIYMACCGNDKIGSIRFEDNGEVEKVSVMLNPKFTGKGLGSKIIRIGTWKFISEKKPGKPVVAEIKRDNIASIKAFERAGFKESFITFIFDEKQGNFE
ncbi:MAG: GNAT family N-acetyltransferase [Deltaproteobacteria bacterium]|nr:GNAT family N-acetyltransferase [Deltaproteobacteria bacterium]